MKKVKIEIKNRFTGNVLFEYEKEDNTMKKTVEKAIKEGADLEGAYLEGADLEGADLEGAYLKGADLEGAYLKGAYLKGAYLKGADLEGAYLEGAYLKGADLEGADLEGAYLFVDDYNMDVDEIVKNIEENSNLKIKETYINRNVNPTRWNCFWKYGLIICDWEVKENKPEPKKMTVSEICKELGYEVEIIKEED